MEGRVGCLDVLKVGLMVVGMVGRVVGRRVVLKGDWMVDVRVGWMVV